ncbi:MAG: efflux RND transporter periplasmic adaptor subunit [Oleiphilaceae bacterium]|nr:efflux RND transporter periplasmic adaptor subunit [Oleiphilaceae bacterium]
MKSSKAVTLAGFVLMAALSGVRPLDASEKARESAVPVRIAAVEHSGSVSPRLRFSGIAQASRRATLSFQVSGSLSERAVTLGQSVQAGDVLARLYNPGLAPAKASAKARLQELETRLDQSQREWRRASRLRQTGAVSEQSLEQLASSRDSLAAMVTTAEADFAQASQLLGESVLQAPFAGRVVALLVEPDEFVTVGQPVVKLAAPEHREVEIHVPAYLLQQVAVGQTVPVWMVQQPQAPALSGQVLEIAQAGAERGQLHPVLVALPNGEAGPGVGESLEVGLSPRVAGSLTVPLLAVMGSAQSTSVFRVEDEPVGDGAVKQRIQKVPIVLHRILGERVVVSGDSLAAGDRVVYSGLTRLTDGDRVRVLK